MPSLGNKWLNIAVGLDKCAQHQKSKTPLNDQASVYNSYDFTHGIFVACTLTYSNAIYAIITIYNITMQYFNIAQPKCILWLDVYSQYGMKISDVNLHFTIS